MIIPALTSTCSMSLLASSALHHGMHSTWSSGAEEAGLLWRLQPSAYQLHQTEAAPRKKTLPPRQRSDKRIIPGDS
jgi:hypothetical protein